MTNGAMQNISLAIPDDIVFEVCSLPGKDKAVNEKLQSRLAIGMFVSQEISLAKAAQLAGQSISEFMDTLKGLGIPSVSYTEDMLLDDLKFADAK
jgi:predicted HTH domain antitoxin